MATVTTFFAILLTTKAYTPSCDQTYPWLEVFPLPPPSRSEAFGPTINNTNVFKKISPQCC